jgi:hypothetical protein
MAHVEVGAPVYHRVGPALFWCAAAGRRPAFRSGISAGHRFVPGALDRLVDDGGRPVRMVPAPADRLDRNAMTDS